MTFTRKRAFAVHLGISLIIFLFMLFVILTMWYPPPLFSLDGGWQGIRIIAAVDIILGPLLTLIVFKPGKPGLKFDLAVIALVQTAALMYGSWIVHQERPWALVFVEDRFYTITGPQLAAVNMEQEDLNAFGDHLPVQIYSELPEDEATLYKVRWNAVGSQRPLYFLKEFYRPMNDEYRDSILLNAIDMESHVAGKPEAEEVYRQYRKKQKKPLIYFPLNTRWGSTIVSVDPNTWELIDSLDIEPPELRILLASETLPGQQENTEETGEETGIGIDDNGH